MSAEQELREAMDVWDRANMPREARTMVAAVSRLLEPIPDEYVMDDVPLGWSHDARRAVEKYRAWLIGGDE